MKRLLFQQKQARKVKTRLRTLQHSQRISHNVSQTCRFIRISGSQFYIWQHRLEKSGSNGLRDRPRKPNMIRYRVPSEVIGLILRIREERRYGAVPMSSYVHRHYQVYVSPTTILKIFRRHRVSRVSLKRYAQRQSGSHMPISSPASPCSWT